ncbi:PaaI family thioesterase [Azotosporobacter soli]|uniref:PaaI family thioesterase n=1 Tax=Azotosporobacter soli TaxID=3055040 RepID=UPI0031FF3CB2
MEERNHWCFACGKLNPIGLQLEFEQVGEEYRTTLTPKQEHQGYDGIMHGGLVSTVLDEVMAGYIYALGFNAVTARLEVRYRKPTPIGQPLTATARIVQKRGRMYEMAGEIRLPDGTITAEGKATVMAAKEESI